MDYQILSFGQDSNAVDILCLDSPIEKGLAGYAKSSLFPANVGLVVDITPSEILEYDYACLAHYRNNDSYMVHMEASIFNGIKANDPMSLTTLFHELGHYVNRDLEDKALYSSEYEDERSASILNGKANERELAADRFAAMILGNDIVVKGLEALKLNSLQHYVEGEDDPELLNLNQLELQYRIEVLSIDNKGNWS